MQAPHTAPHRPAAWCSPSAGRTPRRARGQTASCSPSRGRTSSCCCRAPPVAAAVSSSGGGRVAPLRWRRAVASLRTHHGGCVELLQAAMGADWPEWRSAARRTARMEARRGSNTTTQLGTTRFHRTSTISTGWSAPPLSLAAEAAAGRLRWPHPQAAAVIVPPAPPLLLQQLLPPPTSAARSPAAAAAAAVAAPAAAAQRPAAAAAAPSPPPASPAAADCPAAPAARWRRRPASSAARWARASLAAAAACLACARGARP